MAPQNDKHGSAAGAEGPAARGGDEGAGDRRSTPPQGRAKAKNSSEEAAGRPREPDSAYDLAVAAMLDEDVKVLPTESLSTTIERALEVLPDGFVEYLPERLRYRYELTRKRPRAEAASAAFKSTGRKPTEADYRRWISKAVVARFQKRVERLLIKGPRE